MDTTMMPGAFIERGEITAKEGDEYTVKSLDRYGIETAGLTGAEGGSYSTGEKVYFFLFRDGTGKILCRM